MTFGILLAGIASIHLVTKANDIGDERIVWWRTRDAVVTQGGDGECSVLLYDKQQTVLFTWHPDGSIDMALQSDDLHLDQNRQIDAVVNIDGNWITQTDADDAPHPVSAIGDMDTFAVTLDKPLTPLLQHASRISASVFYKTRLQVNFSLDSSKMPSIMDKVSKCRARLKKPR